MNYKHLFSLLVYNLYAVLTHIGHALISSVRYIALSRNTLFGPVYKLIPVYVLIPVYMLISRYKHVIKNDEKMMTITQLTMTLS